MNTMFTHHNKKEQRSSFVVASTKLQSCFDETKVHFLRLAMIAVIMIAGMTVAKADIGIVGGRSYIFKNASIGGTPGVALTWHHDGPGYAGDGTGEKGCQIITLDYSDYQKWLVEDAGEGWFYLKNEGRGKYLGSVDGVDNAWKLQFFNFDDVGDKDRLRFKFVDHTPGTDFTISFKYNGKGIGVDATASGSACYGDKDTEAKKIYWSAIPVPDPPTFTYDGTNLTISCATVGAAIRYTTDGSEPAVGSAAYSIPLAISAGDVVKAIGVVDGVLTSSVATFSAICNAPKISKDESIVSLTCDFPAGASIYYTTDGSDPASSGSRTLYSSSIDITSMVPVTFKAIAERAGYSNSTVAEKHYVGLHNPDYYAIHQNGKGYLKIGSANVTLSNDGTFRYAELFSNDGNSIWLQTEKGYLQNGYFYLNVANDQTLYLSVHPVTEWDLTDIVGNAYGKKAITCKDALSNTLYLCNDNNTIKLTDNAEAAHYNACPITLEEEGWSGPTNENLTVQSPQIVTYLRNYYTQTFDYSFHNDAGIEVAESAKTRRVYALQEYASGGDNKGTNWDITADGVIYNKKASGNVDVTATYNLTPADPLVPVAHKTAVQKDIKLTIQNKSFTPNGAKDYLMFNLDANDYHFLNDPDAGGYVGPGVKKNQLTESPNAIISWKIEVDEQGFYSFKNVRTGKYFYYDASDYVADVTGYGTLKQGSSSIPDDASKNNYRFRIYKTNDGTYGDVWAIIPYDQQFVVYKSDGVANDIFSSLNAYVNKPTKVISQWKPSSSRWKFYAYEVESNYRLKDFEIQIPNSIKANSTTAVVEEAGSYNLTAESWHWKSIVGAPVNNTELEIAGSGSRDDITYTWEVTGLDGSVTYTSTTTSGKSTLATTVTMPSGAVLGTIKCSASVSSPGALAKSHTIEFHLMPDVTEPTESDFTEITSLSEITSATGYYKLTTDVSDAVPESYRNFQGYLDGDGHTISGLSAPLFTTLSGNGVVRNLNLSGVSISGSGNVGAIAGEATGNTRIYNVGVLSGSISGSDYTGGIVGKLDGYSRVINCFSYANITGGSTVGGIVGYNSFASTSNDIRTMVMNCIFYGDITGGSSRYPVYGGELITNKYTNASNTGLGNYNYFRQESTTGTLAGYNAALAVEEFRLNRFEFIRYLLNSNRELAAWYVKGSTENAKDVIEKWALDPERDTDGKRVYPYPVLKEQGRYASLVNRYLLNPDTKASDMPSNNYTAIDFSNIADETAARVALANNRYKGGKMGELAVTVVCGPSGVNPNTSSSIGNVSLSLPITDMNPDENDFGFRKVQLPYYNSVFDVESNYGTKVCTGWKITAVTSDGKSTNKFSATTKDYADPTDYGKDLYGTGTPANGAGGRVFSQGGYYYVPDGVTAITIEAYWGTATYLADPNLDYTLSLNGTLSNTLNAVTKTATRTTGDNAFKESYKIHTSWSSAADATTNNSNLTVYDNAVVLVGNYHLRGAYYSSANHPHTVMSVDLDCDDEPDYCFMYQSTEPRKDICPIRWDFVNAIDLGTAAKPAGSTNMVNFGIMHPNKHFEITETCLLPTTEFELNGQNRDLVVILNGGRFMQFTTSHENAIGVDKIKYVILGGNVHMKEFQWGCHSDKDFKTPQSPFSVMGGDFDKFYLTGTYKPDASGGSATGDAHCYINGGRFGELAGAGQEQLGGDVNFTINNALITDFYGGGINKSYPVQGNINVTINNSKVEKYCGGPKFGNMQTGKTVTTNATGTVFGIYYGAGNGGTSLYRVRGGGTTGSSDGQTEGGRTPAQWASWINEYFGGSDKARGKFKTGQGVGVSYGWEYFSYAGGYDAKRVARFYVDYATLDKAATKNVSSTLNGCVVLGNYYGGGNLGAVQGNAVSHLTGCNVFGSAFGGGYSASIPSVTLYDANRSRYGSSDNDRYPSANDNTGLFFVPELPGTDTLVVHWQHTDTPIANNATSGTLNIEGTNRIIYTNEPTTGLGAVEGNTELTIDGASKIRGSVYGGGEESDVLKVKDNAISKNVPTNLNPCNTVVNIEGTSHIVGNVYGGGKGKADNFLCDKAMVSGTTTVNVDGTALIVGTVYGGGEVGRVEQNTTVKIGKDCSTPEEIAASAPTVNGNVFGAGAGVRTHGYSALVRGHSAVTVQGSAKVKRNVYGGGELATLGRHRVANNDSESPDYINTVRATYPNAVLGMPFALNKDYDNDTGLSTLTIKDNAEIGTVDNTATGHVFGAGKGMIPYHDLTGATIEGVPWRMTTGDAKEYFSDDPGYEAPVGATKVALSTYYQFMQTLALTACTEVTVTGNAHVRGSVYGGSENGQVQSRKHSTIDDTNLSSKVTVSGGQIDQNVYGGGKGDVRFATAGKTNYGVEVDITDGTIDGNVYGGGAIASSNCFDSRDTDANMKALRESEETYATTVNLHGGIVKGDAFGGGEGVHYVSTAYEGQAAYMSRTAATPSIEDNCAAIVYGDVVVNLGDLATPATQATAFELNTTTDDASNVIPTSGRVFGCNNINGTPKGTVRVNVAKTWGLNGAARKTYAGEDPANQKPAKTPMTDYNAETNPTGFDMNLHPGTYELEAVYGGGNLAGYDPYAEVLTAAPTTTPLRVTIDGCDLTSIKYVYGGGNAAPVPTTDVRILGTYEIGTVFGGGNGKDKFQWPGSLAWNANNGADVGIKSKVTAGEPPVTTTTYYGTNSTTKPETATKIGNATTGLVGGTIHLVFGGSNSKGDISGAVAVETESSGTCDLQVGKMYGGGNAADSQGDIALTIGCLGDDSRIEEVYGGAYGANIDGAVTLNIIGGNIGKVFGGNDHTGSISGKITVNINHTDDSCPWNVDYVYGGGNQAPYTAPFDTENDEYDAETNPIRIASPEVNIIKGHVNYAVFGGGLGETAIVTGNPTVNIGGISATDDNWVSIGGASNNGTPSNTSDDFTAVGQVFGGGDAAKVDGSTTVKIGTGDTYTVEAVDYTRDYAIVNGDVFGGGNHADITGNTTITISGITRGLSSSADEAANTAQGSVYVAGSVYGGGNLGSVGTFKVGSSDWDETAKPTSCETGTGLCTVIINGYAEIGPDNMQMTAMGGPDDKGHVFGASKGGAPAETATDAEAALFEYKTYADRAEVTIGGYAFVKGCVFGGSENGHVLHDTHVTIQESCQIGNGDGVNRRYTEGESGEWATATSLAECAHWPYDENHSGEAYDPFHGTPGYDSNGAAKVAATFDSDGNMLTDGVSDGRTFYGSVFGGGSGYFPYAPGKWLASAGAVYGNATVDITGGHILTSVYGGNEMTDVGKFTFNADGTTTVVSGGNTTINMVAGTVGVPRTDAQMRAHPVTCYVFGAGKGDPRVFFNQFTNVASATVNITGNARIYGSTFGGGEDGHVVGNVVTNIGGTVKIDLNRDGDTDD